MMILIMNNRGIFMRACFCPNCGASLNFDDNNRDFGFCQFCGAKIILDDYRSTHRVVDEARIHEDETNRMIKMREMEMEERERDKKREETAAREHQIEMEYLRKNRLQLIKTLASFFVALILILIGIFSFQSSDESAELFGVLVIILSTVTVSEISKTGEDKKRKNIDLGLIQLTDIALSYKNTNYRLMQSVYTKLGFIHVTTVNIKDLTTGLIKSPGSVDTVTIDGKLPQKDEWYDPNAKVVIKYHGFNNR